MSWSLANISITRLLPRAAIQAVPRFVWVGSFVLAAILIGIMPFVLPETIQFSVIFLVPALLIGLLIFRNPFFGLCLYFFYDFFRPYDMIPALRPLRLAIAIEIVTLLSTILWIKKRSKSGFEIRWDKFNWAYLAFLALIAVSVITSVNNRYAYDKFQLMAISFVILLIATNVINSTSQLQKLVLLLMAIHFYLSLRGITNYLSGRFVYGGLQTSGVTGSSFLSDENDFALAMNTFIPFGFFLTFYFKRGIKKIASLVFLVVLVFAVVSSMSRGGWVGLVAVLGYCILKSKKKVVALSVTVLLVAAILVFAPSSYWHEVRTISDTGETTAQSRLNYWKAAFEMYADHPVAGVGAGNGGIWLPYYITGYANPFTQWGRAFHGTIPQLMAELGTIGTVIYFAMFLLIFAYMGQVTRRESAGETGNYQVAIAKAIKVSMVGYLVTSTFLSTLYYPQIWTLYVLALIVYKLGVGEKRQPEPAEAVPAYANR